MPITVALGATWQHQHSVAQPRRADINDTGGGPAHVPLSGAGTTRSLLTAKSTCLSVTAASKM